MSQFTATLKKGFKVAELKILDCLLMGDKEEATKSYNAFVLETASLVGKVVREVARGVASKQALEIARKIADDALRALQKILQANVAVAPNALTRINTALVANENARVLEKPFGDQFCKDFFRSPQSYSLKPMGYGKPVTLLQYICSLNRDRLLLLFKTSCAQDVLDVQTIKKAITQSPGLDNAKKKGYCTTLDTWGTANAIAKEALILHLIQSPHCLPLDRIAFTDSDNKMTKVQLAIADQWFQSVYPAASLERFKSLQKYYSQITLSAPLNFSASPEPTAAEPNPSSLTNAIPLRPFKPSDDTNEIFMADNTVVFRYAGNVVLGNPNTPLSSFCADFAAKNDGIALQSLRYGNPHLIDVVIAANPQAEQQKFYEALKLAFLIQQQRSDIADANRFANITTLIDYARENKLVLNLSNIDCHNFDFSTVNLSNVNFTKANLTGANLAGANLAGANLKGITISTSTNVTDIQLNDKDALQKTKKKLIARLTQYIDSRGSSDPATQKFSQGVFGALFRNAQLTGTKVAAAKEMILQISAATTTQEIAAALRDQLQDDKLNKSGVLTSSHYTQCLLDCSQIAFPPREQKTGERQEKSDSGAAAAPPPKSPH
ncbi:MAG: hypothetical protein A3F13_03155 [Gammaproteobacteria bacterium RIFCSPHIGHO2_12_FULL_40_19]|nr:MAG: hypothetical protein A3F13_03155 [Gammaproteobacteria bacterium RIFCSPHIGHO2_12_FULL_40_19]